MMRCPCFSVTVPNSDWPAAFSYELTAPVAGLKPRLKLFPLNDHRGWFRKLYALKRNWSFIDSLMTKFLNIPRSALKKAGPYMAGSTLGPFWPICVGKAKHLGLIY